MKALLLIAILLKDLIIKQCIFNYMCCKALNGKWLYGNGLERRYKKSSCGLLQGNKPGYLPGRCKGKQSINQAIQTLMQ